MNQRRLGSCYGLGMGLLKEMEEGFVTGQNPFYYQQHTDQWLHRGVKRKQERSALEGVIMYRNYCQTLQP